MKISLFYGKLLLLVLAITIAYFLGEGAKNLLLIGVMAFAPLFYIFNSNKKTPLDYSLLTLLALMFTFPYLSHPETYRLSTLLYAAGFITSFLFLKDMIYKGAFKLDYIVKFLKIILYAYTIVLVIQQVCVIADLPIFNQKFIFEGFKLSSLADEPSHLAFYEIVLMYSYVLLREIEMKHKYTLIDVKKKDKYVWLGYFWVMLTCQSTSALLLSMFIFVRFIKLKNILKYAVIGIVIFILLSTYFKDSHTLERAINFVEVLFTFDIYKIDSVDHSAAYRLVPFFAYADTFQFFSIDTFWGHGIDAAAEKFGQFMYDVSQDGAYLNGVALGGLPGYMYTYGLIITGVLTHSIYLICKEVNNLFYKILIISVVLFYGFNVQMTWFSFTLAIYVNYKYKEYKRYLLVKRKNLYHE